jgi:hypothetical protein
MKPEYLRVTKIYNWISISAGCLQLSNERF